MAVKEQDPFEPIPFTLEDENQALNQQLDERLKKLNAVIDAHEQALKAMMVPRDVWLVYHSEQLTDDQGQESYKSLEYLLGMVKWNGTWRLSSCVFNSPSHAEFKWKPLVDSSIPERLRAVGHLEKLRAEVVKEKEKLIPELDAAVLTAANALDGYGKSQKPGKRK